MASRYEHLFSRLKHEGRKAFIPYTMLGYPDKKHCLEAVKAMIESGVSALELGLAFSDPLADGPVIQEAASRTIESGFKTMDAFALIKEIRKFNSEIPITLMCYYNSVLAHKSEGFCNAAQEAGVDALLIVDLPPELSKEFSRICAEKKLEQVFIISPLTSEERLQLISQKAGGFLYAVSRLGITGVEERYDENLQILIEKAKKLAKLPVAVGFGVSTPEQAQKMFNSGADAVITGSRIVEMQTQIKKGKIKIDDLKAYVRTMLAACSGVSAKSK